jgi:hypothetical protein
MWRSAASGDQLNQLMPLAEAMVARAAGEPNGNNGETGTA